MKNPFEYGSIVGDQAFCDRQEELAELRRAIDDGQRVFMYGERRLGKTSLVKRLLSKLGKKQYVSVYIDLWPTDSDGTFINAFASALTEAASTTPQKMLEFARSFFGQLAPSVTLDHNGKPEITFKFARNQNLQPTLDELLAAPERIAEKLGKRLVVVFDEFQQLFEYEGDIVERALRTALQEQPNVSYIFLGSRKHVITKMVLDRSRPFYKAGPHFSLRPIPKKEWIDFIRERFEKSGKTISGKHIDAIYALTEGHPFYTQHLCHALWELTEQYTTVTDEKIRQALDLLLAREDYAYDMIWESLALSQRRLLEGLALDGPEVQIYSAEFLDRFELKSASTAQRAVKALFEREIIDLEGGHYFIIDRFFRQWIARKHR